MIPMATVSTWEIIAPAILGMLALAGSLFLKRTPYQDLEDRIRRPKAWAIRHPVQAIKRRSR